jgi:hypothetical protein
MVIPLLAADLAITDVRLREYEDGPNLSLDHVYHPGETIFLSFHIKDFKVVGDEEPRIKLTYRVEATDPQGRPLTTPKTGTIDTDIAPEDKKWTPIVRFQAPIPPAPESGTYTITIHAADTQAETETIHSVRFAVDAGKLETSASLTVRNFRLYRTADAPQPMSPGSSIRPGDTVWARFDVTGYKIGEKNKYQVQYGIALADETGKELFSAPQAAGDGGEPFYPRRSFPGSLNFTLDKQVKPGLYKFTITLRDVVGDQTAESVHDIRVEK